ncbi:subtilisin-like protease [Manihot esculenta]|uniref:Uncharacterized protein n=1 Tax=Manihot esculenta TaxID=3983 RepID=A0A2C9UAS0_MANES|nr:subtilisin-like protease [Manihot esculenta]OAY27178.1 hypothetical protein MANES_16G106100v8 [Manihot esculenta]
MENRRCKMLPTMLFMSLFILTFMFSSSSTSTAYVNEEGDLETYIVLLKKPEGNLFTESKDLESWYRSFLAADTSDKPRLIHHYRHVATGFAAKLTADEAKAMEMREELLLFRPQRMVPLHTTRTPSFLGLQQNLGFWKSSNYGEGVIIGVVDSGIAPDHPSFSGEGMPPPPAKWKGKCEFNATLCNNKLIGLRNFDGTSNDMFDRDKHGTHTSGTAAGSPVKGASLFGQANGTAIGMAPLAHLAMYKVSGRDNKTGEAEVLAAMDAAIDDGVDVLSLSIGYNSHPFYDDAIAIGAYAAIQKGIFVSCSAGNDGPVYRTLSNEAPWILTVGASTHDREIRATVLLGNNKELNGESLFQPKDFHSSQLPLVYAGASGNASSASCEKGSLRKVDVKGKVVLCEGGSETISKGKEVKRNRGAAIIIMNDEIEGFYIQPDHHVLPASHVSYAAGSAIKAYINSTSSPTATILFKGTVTGVPTAPQVAWFSSRGPSIASPGILKPDIIGPGQNILAAYPVSVDLITKFGMISGTSMSCPHLSGIAALLKSAHPNWSPAAVKSAIMTTANLRNLGGEPISEPIKLRPANFFDMGAGHVNPSRANDPGLVYDLKPNDYIPYLCGLGYSDKQVRIIVQQKVKCSNKSSIPESQLNYPSFSILLGSTLQKYTRKVTNVGRPNSVYSIDISSPEGVLVKVTPRTIRFSRLNQKATYSVTFSKRGNVSISFAEGYLKWVTDGYSVGSPIAVLFT